MRLKEFLVETRKKYDFKQLKNNQVPLSEEERKIAMDAGAFWDTPQGKQCAVWKSKNPKTGETVYITHTHRAFRVAPTLKGAIREFHSFIKDTA